MTALVVVTTLWLAMFSSPAECQVYADFINQIAEEWSSSGEHAMCVTERPATIEAP